MNHSFFAKRLCLFGLLLFPLLLTAQHGGSNALSGIALLLGVTTATAVIAGIVLIIHLIKFSDSTKFLNTTGIVLSIPGLVISLYLSLYFPPLALLSIFLGFSILKFLHDNRQLSVATTSEIIDKQKESPLLEEEPL